MKIVVRNLKAQFYGHPSDSWSEHVKPIDKCGDRAGRLERRRRAAVLWRSCMEALEQRQLLSGDVLMWRGDNGGTGNYNQETVLTPANVNSSQFGKLENISLPGGSGDQVYAQPLYVSNVTITGQGTNNGVHNIVIVATEANNVYAFDTTTFTKVWSLNLGPVIPNRAAGGPNFNNFNGSLGVTGTPVIDPTTDIMYLDSTQEPSSGVFVHKIFGIDITTGATASAMTLGNVAGGVVPEILGTSSDSIAGYDTFIPKDELQRPGLTILNGNVYVAYGSYGDTDPYHGWVLGFDENTLALTAVFDTTPNQIPGGPTGGAGHDGEGAIWMSGASLSTDGTNLYLVSANGDFDTQASFGAYGDAVLKLTPNSTTLANQSVDGYGLGLTDYFAPSNQATLGNYQVDLDLGTSGVLLLPTQSGPNPNEAVVIGKQGVAYLLNTDDLGQFNAISDDIPGEISLNGHGMWGTPAYFNNTVYFQAAGDVLKAYSLTNGQISSQPVASSGIAISNEGASPVISSDGTSDGIVWILSNNHNLYAYDATTLTELYDSNQNSSNADKLGTTEHFAVPMVANGEVFVAGAGFLSIYGEKSNPFASLPGAPANLSVSNTIGGRIALSWTSTASLNEQYFAVERSTDNFNFTQIGTAPVDAKTYADTTTVAGQTYFYRVRAVNDAGASGYTNTASAVAQTYSTAVDSYNFDALSGTTVSDAGTNNITGTLTGSTLPQWTTGYSGGALSFSGNGAFNSTLSQSAVQVTNSGVSNVLGATSSMTLWIKTTQTGSVDPTKSPAIMGVTKLNSSGIGFPPRPLNVQDGENDIRWGYIDATGHIGLAVDGYLWVSNPADTFGVVSTTPVNDGQWHFVAMTRDSATGILQVFVDGVLQGQFVGDTGAKTTSFNMIGAQIEEINTGQITGENYFNGDIDDLHIYNQVLPASEIASLASMPATPANLAAAPLSSSSVQLTWNNMPILGDSIEIDRSVGSPTAFSPLFTVSGAASSFIDTGLIPGTQYFYELKAINSFGSSAFTVPVGATPEFAQILGRNVFYNDSAFDGDDPAANSADAGAIDPSKSALLPGESATFANYTNYVDGLNGISIDVANLSAPATVTLSDFSFMTGNSADTGTWTSATAPDQMAVFPGAGAGGSTRIEFIWNTPHAVKDAWLQVTMSADANTNLENPDVFYFGNQIAEGGNSPTDAKVSAVDVIFTRSNAGTGVSVNDPYDYNKDGNVDVDDGSVALTHPASLLSCLKLIAAPVLFNLVPADPFSGTVSPEVGGAAPAISDSILPGPMANDNVAPQVIIPAASGDPAPNPAPAIHKKNARATTAVHPASSAVATPSTANLPLVKTSRTRSFGRGLLLNTNALFALITSRFH